MALIVITYHAIASQTTAVSVTRRQLAEDLDRVQQAGFSFVTLDDCLAWLHGRRTIPARSLAITFDDGYASVVDDAWPVLQAAGAPAAMFVIAGRIGADNAWPGQRRGVPRLALADASALRAMAAAGMTMGAHSWTHPVLPALAEDALASEVDDARARVEDLTGAPVRYFAYPYGTFGERERSRVASVYDGALSSAPRVVGHDADPHAIPRLDAHDLRLALAIGALHPGRLRPYLALRRAGREARQALARGRRPLS